MSTGYYPIILYPPPVRQLYANGSNIYKQIRSSLQECVQLHRDNEAQQGVSEKQFFRHLLSAFSNYIICQAVEFAIPDSPRRYSADFILYQQHSGLGIDIEVDEPYAGDTGKPHHCIDKDDDKIRNRFFLERNWVVVRFAEVQVVKHPWSCCKAIAQTIARLTGDRSSLLLLQRLPDVPMQKQWTIRDAKQMAKNDYRQSYLPKMTKRTQTQQNLAKYGCKKNSQTY